MEKEGSKSGGYVGGFFQLFDWKAKSRKKLFSSKLDFPERSKQGKRGDGNLPMTRLHLLMQPDEDETGAGSSIKGGSDYSCASSVTDEDGYGARAPSVVAKLMGLDSMPTSNEPFSSPFSDTQSLQDAPYRRKNLDYLHDQQIIYSGNLYNKVDCNIRDFVESKPQKMANRPLEKFQTEMLPPKSAKSIPITHHKLLSPIKNPGFVPTKNAAHIMEAAAKIIEPGSRANTRSRMPLVGSSSAPLKVRELKEKVEATQRTPLVGSSSVPLRVKDLKEKAETARKTSRVAEAPRRPVESNAVKYLKGQSLNKSWNGSTETTPSFRTAEIEEGHPGVKNKGKSVSLAIQAKVNVQRRESLSSSSSRSLVAEKEENEFKSSQTFRSQPNIQKNLHKKPSTNSSSSVLRQNNQKQNCMVDKDKLSAKPSVSNNSQGRKLVSGDTANTRQKSLSRTVGNSKTGSRKLGSDTVDSEKGNPYTNKRNVSRKKRSIERDIQLEKDNPFVAKNLKANRSNSPIDDTHYSWAEDNKRKGMDVVSFTFSAPLTRSMHGSEASSGQTGQRKDCVFTDNRSKRLLLDTESMKLSSLGYNVIGADALSLLLEQKLRELSYRAESSSHDSFKVGSSSSSVSNLPDPTRTRNPFDIGTRLQDKGDRDLQLRHKLERHYDTGSQSSEYSAFRTRHKFQGVDEMDECSSNSLDVGKMRDYRHPSPVSILEPSFSTESCNSSDSAEGSSTEGSKHCSSIQAQEVLGLNPSKKFHPLEAEIELSDSASSSSATTLAKMASTTRIMSKLPGPTKWETEYIKQILCNMELMFKDFSLGRSREVINPHLFDLLENRKPGSNSDADDSKLTRKVFFDCVSECMGIRCTRFVGGGYKTWTKGVAMVRRKDRLAEEVYKEISGWNGMGDCMVDELVDKDMSSQYGKWQDFEVDAFELGLEIQGQILNSLVEEVVGDILQF